MRRDTFLKSILAMAAAGALPTLAQASTNLKLMIPANPGGGWDATGRDQTPRVAGWCLADAGGSRRPRALFAGR